MSEQPSGQMPPSQPAPPQPVPSQPAPPQPAPPQSAVPPQAAAPPQPAPPLQPQPAPPLQPAAPPPPQPAPPQYAPQAAPSQPQPVAPPSQPASQAQITDALNAQGGVAEGMHRIHPAYIVLNSLQALLVVVIIAISSLAPMISSVSAGDIGVSIGAIAITAVALLLLLAAIVGFGIFYYLRFSWGLSESEVCINSGIIFKKQVRIPFQKVQSIDFQARVIERIVGIVRLKIETAGGVSNRAVGIPALKLNQAEALRAEVFRRKQQASALENANIQAMINARRNQPAAALDGASGATITPRFDPQTGAPLPAPAPASAAFTPRFDPQTGAPLPAPAPASAAFTPRFDPQTGAPLPAAFPPPTAPAPAAFAPPAPGAPFAPPVQSSADTIVGGLGELSSQMRGVFAGSYDENAPIEYEYGLRARELFLAGLSSDQNILGMVVIFFALT
ncbi:MAG: PH domain-containing protein, partial [Coriobacteriia bacterium]|nr:PH domain-containing protein [Coriobacteriia bacterium]